MFPELAWKLPRIAVARFVASFVLYALWVGMTAWLVSLLNALVHPQGSFLKRAALKPLSLAAGALVYIVHAVGHALSYSVSHSMPSAAHWLNELATREMAINNAEANFAEQTASSFERLVHHTIPAEIRAETVPLKHGIDQLERDFPRLRAQLAHFRVGIDRLLRDNIMPRVRANERAIDITIPREIGRIRARTGALERGLASPSRSWVKAIWRYGWVLVGAGLMVKFLTRKFPHLFCRNTTKALRGICGIGSSLFDDIFAFAFGEALAALVIVDICDTIKVIETVGEQFEPAIRALILAEDDFFAHCGYELPTGADPPGYSGPWLATGT